MRVLPFFLLPVVLLFFARLDLPLLEPQEARYAEIPRQMLSQDSWLVPILHGQPYLDKPPLLYWLVMLSYRQFGVHDWAARLVPAFSGLLTVLVAFWWARRVAGERAAIFGALMLCLSARYVYLARMLTFDTLLCLWVTAALACAHVALTENRRRWWLLSALLCGLGVLTKGPVAVVLVAVPVMFLRPRLVDALLYLLVLLLVSGPWFLWMMLHHAEFAHHFFWQHHVIRFVEPFDHREPFWFHLPGVLLGMLPWTLLLPGLVRSLRQSSPTLRFLAVSAAWGLLFFSLAGCKRATYILPALPPLALALGCYLDTALPACARLARPATLVTLGIGTAGFLAASISGLLSWPLSLTLAALALLLAVRSVEASWPRCMATTFAMLLVAILLILPAYHDRFALRECVEDYADVETAIVCYPRSWDSVSFYLRRDDVRCFAPEQRAELLDELKRRPQTLLFVKGERTGESLLRELPEGLVFTLEQQKGAVLMGWVHSADKSIGAQRAAGFIPAVRTAGTSPAAR